MAPKKSQVNAQYARSESSSVDASQTYEADYIEEVTKERSKRIKARRAQRKQQVLTAHNERVAQLQNKIEKCFQKHDEQVRAVRRVKVQQLIDLARKKQDVEIRLQKSQAELQQAFLSAAKQLQLALEGRVEELS